MDRNINYFVQPKRRLTRQRSGFNVGGVKTGSECKILPTQHLKITSKNFVLNKKLNNVIFTELFGQNIGIFGVGGYFKTDKNALLTIRIKLFDNDLLVTESYKKIRTTSDQWIKVGADLQLDIEDVAKEYQAAIYLDFKLTKQPFELEFYDLYADVVKYYAEKPSYKNPYYEKTDLYRPDIYYLNPTVFDYKKEHVEFLKPGFLVCKSCNRCARFLPIDITNEINALGFSNHCKKKIPCTHNAFNRYRIENIENIKLIPSKNNKSVLIHAGNQYIHTYYGFQLECRTCKKFVVNAPLNPLRNKSQHHEDGARRRAFERLIIELTGKDVVKNFRLIKGVEFQDYIWKRFSKKCFGCGKELKKISDMDIDHTLPLVYLWPLDNSATALCQTCNSQKHELFPGEFKLYSKEKLVELSKLTGIPLKIIENKERVVNKIIADLLVQKVDWLFDKFLAHKDYQKVKKGKKVADLIYKALNKILTTINIDLVTIYKKKTGKLPTTITLE
ncbi:MAG: hypothetical protein KJ915_05715 [Candidatus Omnitrophica bacterium]|nr:hypothetical protein [Candidatus Omnitrophota bacterium]